jgi:hypothetical protein
MSSELPVNPELDRIVSLDEAVRLSTLSRDGWRRYHADKLIRLSPRRVGVRLRDVLQLKPTS